MEHKLIDKFEGMILLGAYGDALGAPHEGNGLSGLIASPESTRRLPTFSLYRPSGTNPWGVWIDPERIDDAQTGIPTDDTSFRAALLHPWLADVLDRKSSIDEAGFIEWLRKQTEPTADAGQPLEKVRQQQIDAWLCMMRDAERFTKDDTAEPSQCNPFFRRDVPIIFGMFMYLELASIYADAAPESVGRTFLNFCRLDQGYARQATAIAALVMAQAVQADPAKEAFGLWYPKSLEGAVALVESLDPKASLLRPHLARAKEVGLNARGGTDEAFLELVKKNVYEAPVTVLDPQEHLRNFDPLLFLMQISSTVAYAQDGLRAVQLLAAGPGDADTLPSQLGSIVGAWSGAAGLRARSELVARDLDATEQVLSSFYDVEVHEIARTLSQLSDRVH